MMEESRFSRFIKTIEEATNSLPPAKEINNPSLELEAAEDKASADEEIESSEEINAPGQPSAQTIPVPSAQPTDTIKTFLKLGASFLSRLSESLNTEHPCPLDKKDPPNVSAGIRLHQDQATGQMTLHVPLPDEDTLKQIGSLLGEFLKK